VRGRGRRSVVAIVVTLAGCAPATPSGSDPPARIEPSAVAVATPSPTFALGQFPDFPTGVLPGSIAEALQAELDARIEAGTFSGVTAAVVVADRGSWTGAAGSAGGISLTPDSRTPTHSVGKTIVTAQILRLAEDGMLDLDDLASEHLPPELGWYDANGATIRQVLGMRSGIPNVPGAEDNYYPAEEAQTAVEVFRMLPEPTVPPGDAPEYSDLNFVLLGTVIEHVTGRPLDAVLRSDVLDDPALGLDPIMRKQFNRDLITHLQGEGRTVFYSSHLLYEVEPVADEVAILDQGRIVRQADTESLRRDVKQLIVSREAFAAVDGQLAVLDVRNDGDKMVVAIERAESATERLGREGVEFRVVDLNLDEIFEAYVVGKRSEPSSPTESIPELEPTA